MPEEKPIKNPRGGLAAEAKENKGKKPAKEKKPAKQPKTPKEKKEQPAVSYKGRSKMLRDLKAKGGTFDEAFKLVCEKYPASSIVNCKKVWNSPGRGKKEEKKD